MGFATQIKCVNRIHIKIPVRGVIFLFYPTGPVVPSSTAYIVKPMLLA